MSFSGIKNRFAFILALNSSEIKNFACRTSLAEDFSQAMPAPRNIKMKCSNRFAPKSRIAWQPFAGYLKDGRNAVFPMRRQPATKQEQRVNGADIRQKIAAGKPSIGTWLQFPSADVAETMAQAGYDWVAADMEHGSFGPEILPNIFRAIQCGGAIPLARLPEAAKTWIKAALEAGAMGLIFPMIESAAQLENAIDLATYPGFQPWRKNGSHTARGVGFCRANAFGKNFREYVEKTASEIFLAAQIEHIRALKELDAILAHPRLDAIMVGPYDLSGSMGLTGQFDHPDFQRAMDEIAEACKRHHVAMGCHVVEPDPEALRREASRGSLFIAYGIDTVFLWKSARRPALP